MTSDRFRKPEGRPIEFTKPNNREKINQTNKQSFLDLWDNNKKAHISIIRVLEVEKENKT